MSIAGLVLAAPAERLAEVEAALRGRESVVETRPTPDDALIRGLAVVVERSSADLKAELESLRDLPGVEALHLVYADYEDDLDEKGEMPCPPPGEGRRRSRPPLDLDGGDLA